MSIKPLETMKEVTKIIKICRHPASGAKGASPGSSPFGLVTLGLAASCGSFRVYTPIPFLGLLGGRLPKDRARRAGDTRRVAPMYIGTGFGDLSLRNYALGHNLKNSKICIIFKQ